MDNRENFSALTTLSPGSNGVRSFSSPGVGGINGKRTPVTKKLIIKNLKVSCHNFIETLGKFDYFLRPGQNEYFLNYI